MQVANNVLSRSPSGALTAAAGKLQEAPRELREGALERGLAGRERGRSVQGQQRRVDAARSCAATKASVVFWCPLRSPSYQGQTRGPRPMFASLDPLV